MILTDTAINYIDGLVQERRNSIANALELRLSCTNSSIYKYIFCWLDDIIQNGRWDLVALKASKPLGHLFGEVGNITWSLKETGLHLTPSKHNADELYRE